MQIGLATFDEIPNLTEDDQLMLEPLRQEGFSVQPFIWRSETQERFDVVVTRSCWDFGSYPHEFCRWIEKTARSHLILNSPDLLLWNHNKRYLLDLSARGVRIPRTKHLSKGTPADLEVLGSLSSGMKSVVVKPAVSVNGHNTYCYSISDLPKATDVARKLLSVGDIVLQEFMPEVLDSGEISFVFLSNEFSHAVRKVPRTGEFRVQAEHGGRREAYSPSLSLVLQARKILESIKAQTLFARVDAIVRNGELCVMELELIHPMLFLKYDQRAAGRFASALRSMTQNQVVSSPFTMA